MPEILALLQILAPLLEKTTLRQMSHVLFGMLTASGRMTMLGLSRWTEKGGSYRTIQRFYHTALSWAALHWLFFKDCFLRAEDEYIGAGDEVVISKAGKATYGLDRFFAGLQQRVIPGLAFFTLSLVNVAEERAYPLQTTQVVRSAEEQATSKAKAEAKKKTGEKKKRGRPKGSKNKDKKEVVLTPELLRIQKALQALLETLKGWVSLKYVALDGHFGNYPSAFMVRQTGLHLISKLRSDAALHVPFAGEHKKPGPKPKYGAKIDVQAMEDKYLKETTIKDGLRTDLYQGQFLNKEFAFALNVVVILKTNLETAAQAHVILFSTDLDLSYEKIIQYYSLRFQIEFNFRDAKQYWGLEDFMNVKETAVTNATNLALFMVNFSFALAQPFRQQNPASSNLDLKAHYRGYRYATETIKMLPQKPDGILLAEIFQQIARLGAIHPAPQPSARQ
ncbi:MAG TPA: transposase [Anaerolineales bacterium]|nr:transposase [Anaerolineales bacterium]